MGKKGNKPYTTPTLVIQGTADKTVDVGNGPSLAKVTHGQLWQVEGAGHTKANQVLPDEYIRDHYATDVPLMTTPAGMYTVYMGFWPGGEGKRLKITQGPNDGADRVRLGTIEIK